MSALNLINIEGTTIPDTWFQALYKVLEVGNAFTIDKGSFEGIKRLEFDYITLHIKKPDGGEPGNISHLLPVMPDALKHIPSPLDEKGYYEYLPYLLTEEKLDNEAYTYGNRIQCAKMSLEQIKRFHNVTMTDFLELQDCGIIKRVDLTQEFTLNQMELIIWLYKNKGHRNNQCIMNIAQPADRFLKDPPCLQFLDTRIQDNTLHFFVYFRSWDLWGGFPGNMAAIETMKQYMSNSIGVKNGGIIAFSKGLHIYDYVWELAEAMRGKSSNDFRN